MSLISEYGESAACDVTVKRNDNNEDIVFTVSDQEEVTSPEEELHVLPSAP